VFRPHPQDRRDKEMGHGGEIMHIKRLWFTMLIIILFLCGLALSVETSPNNFVAVYYFHSNFRCVNCHNLEQYTKEAVEKYFKDDLAYGRIVFKVINVETEGNEHFINDYQLYTKSVVLSLVKNGKEIKFDNLTKVWEYLRNKEAFHQYIKSEVEKYIKEL